MRELEIAQMQEAQAEWEREAYEIFSPEDAAVFIQDSKNLSDWLNEREPELCSYINKPYGKHLLKGWMDKIAKNKEMASQWQALNSYEKFRLVDKYYKELEKFGEDYAAGRIDANGQPVGGQTAQTTQQTQQQTNQQTAQQQQTQPDTTNTPPVNAPVPNSGRDTNTMPPSNNFALMLQDAMNKRGVSSF
jgi:sRNA-binding protein